MDKLLDLAGLLFQIFKGLSEPGAKYKFIKLLEKKLKMRRNNMETRKILIGTVVGLVIFTGILLVGPGLGFWKISPITAIILLLCGISFCLAFLFYLEKKRKLNLFKEKPMKLLPFTSLMFLALGIMILVFSLVLGYKPPYLIIGGYILMGTGLWLGYRRSKSKDMNINQLKKG